MKTKILFLISAFLLITGTQIASAARMDIPRNSCSLAVFPFNIDSTENTLYGKDLDPWINKLTTAVCKTHLTIPTPPNYLSLAYSPQTVKYTAIPDTTDIPLKPGALGKHGPITNHIHTYYNDSLEDDFWYISFVDKFVINFAPDTLSNIDYNNISCSTPYPNPAPAGYPSKNAVQAELADCQGYMPKLWGGTKVTKTPNGVTWEFGMDAGGAGKPRIFGKNPTLDPLISQDAGANFNSSLEENRAFGASINLPSINVNSVTNTWSATTTSKILVRDFVINKNTNPANLDPEKAGWCSQAEKDAKIYNKWCPLDPLPGYTVQQVNNRPYYWFPIGSVGTVWKKPPPKEEPSYCTGLQITAPGDLKPLGNNTYEYVPQKGASFRVLPSFFKDPVPLDYRWHAKEYKVNWQHIEMINLFSSVDSKIRHTASNLFTSVLSAPSFEQTITQPVAEITQTAIPIIINYGAFFDNFTQFVTNPSSGKNPYVDTNLWFQPNDRETYYSGGPEGTLITVEGVDPSAPDVYAPEAYVGNNCRALIIIPTSEEQNTCVDLDITPKTIDPLTPVTFTVTPKFQDPTKTFPLDYYWTANSQGDFNKIPYSPQTTESNFSPLDPSLIPQMGQTNLLGQLPMQTAIPAPPGPSQSPVGQLEASPIPLLPSGSSTSPGFNLDFNKVPFPGTGGIIPKILGMFEDFAGAGDLANPYWEKKDEKTHYTGGAAGTLISVQAYGKDGTLYPACKASLQIPPDEEYPEQCLEARIVRGPNGVDVGAEVQLEDPIDGLWVQVATDPQEYEADLSFDWEVNGAGELYSTATNFGTRVTTTNFADTVDLNGAADGTRVTVQAVDPENKLENIAICNDSFVVKDSGEQPICRVLNLTNSNPNLQAGGSTRLKAAPVRDNGTPITVVRWSETGEGSFNLGPSGILLNISFPGYCPQPPASATQTFTAPAECDYIYTAGPNGGDFFRVEAVPHDGVIDCMYQYTVPPTPPPGKPYCVDLQLIPNDITRGGTTNYTGQAIFSDGKIYNVDVDWSGQNGRFNNNTTYQRLTDVPSSNITNSFTHSPADASGRVNAAVTNAYGDVSQNFSLCREIITIPPTEDKKECTYLYLRWPYDELVCIGTDHEGNFIWGKNGTEWTSNELCIPATKKDTITVEAVGYEEICSDEYSPEDTPPEYKLIKRVNINNNQQRGFTTRIQTIPQNHTDVWYQLVFTPSGADSTTVTITDDISKGFLTAMILPVDAEGKPSPGIITYANELTVTEEGYGPLPRCNTLNLDEDEEPEHCYNGDIGPGQGIELVGIKGEVTIGYKATVQSGLTDEICREGQVCQEKYRNSALARVTEVDGESVNIPTIRSNDIEIQIFCQYILTQAAGDIFLERDLSYGIDIQQCSEIASSPGIVITPREPDAPLLGETGPGQTTVFTISHELCTAGLAGQLPSELQDMYGQDVIPNLSAQICEVSLPTGEAWKKEFIVNSIEENKTRLSRWGADATLPPTMAGITQLNDYQYDNVFHLNKTLTIDQQYTLNDGQGAKTFIIEDGDLIIKQDVKYGDCPSGQTCTVRDTASLAFIVLNGNVYIAPGVENIAGVFFVQQGEKPDSGRFYSGTGPTDKDARSMNPLKITGSIFGDIDSLFGNRRYAGDPIEGGGGIVIRFDQRIILNTPPGLRDVLNLTQTEVAR